MDAGAGTARTLPCLLHHLFIPCLRPPRLFSSSVALRPFGSCFSKTHYTLPVPTTYLAAQHDTVPMASACPYHTARLPSQVYTRTAPRLCDHTFLLLRTSACLFGSFPFHPAYLPTYPGTVGRDFGRTLLSHRMQYISPTRLRLPARTRRTARAWQLAAQQCRSGAGSDHHYAHMPCLLPTLNCGTFSPSAPRSAFTNKLPYSCRAGLPHTRYPHAFPAPDLHLRLALVDHCHGQWLPFLVNIYYRLIHPACAMAGARRNDVVLDCASLDNIRYTHLKQRYAAFTCTGLLPTRTRGGWRDVCVANVYRCPPGWAGRATPPTGPYRYSLHNSLLQIKHRNRQAQHAPRSTPPTKRRCALVPRTTRAISACLPVTLKTTYLTLKERAF